MANWVAVEGGPREAEGGRRERSEYRGASHRAGAREKKKEGEGMRSGCIQVFTARKSCSSPAAHRSAPTSRRRSSDLDGRRCSGCRYGGIVSQVRVALHLAFAALLAAPYTIWGTTSSLRSRMRRAEPRVPERRSCATPVLVPAGMRRHLHGFSSMNRRRGSTGAAVPTLSPDAIARLPRHLQRWRRDSFSAQ